MNDIIMMLLSAVAAVAGATVVLAGVSAAITVGSSALVAVGALVANGLPVAICLGGVAYAASKTGYGGL